MSPALTPSALALFDYGYLIETMKQNGAKNTAPASDGYPFVLKALQLGGNDPEMEFAAAVITLWPKRAGYEEHLRKAIAGVTSDPLLASNLTSHIPDAALADLHKNAAASARKR